MKALVATDYGDIQKLQLRDLPDPSLDGNELKVRVHAASLNPVDWKLRKGEAKALMELHFPAVLGRDAAGEVVAVGPNVKHFAVGDRVLGLVMGAYAEFVVAPESAWARLPKSMDLRDAAALPLVVLTGAQLAEKAVDVKAGQVVLVTGAVGGVGRTAVFAAKARGATVWAGVRASQKADARMLGADGVVALDDEKELEKLPALDAIADAVGGETVERLLSHVKKGGVVGTVLAEPKGAAALGLKVHHLLAQPDSKRLAELAEAVAQGKLVIPIAKRFPLAQGREATQLAESGGVGKVLLLM